MKYQYYQDKKKTPQPEWRWRLLDDQGQKIATSHDGHPTKDVCLAEIEKVKSSLNAEVVEDLNTPSLLATLLGEPYGQSSKQP